MDTFPSSPPAAVRADLTALCSSLDLFGILPRILVRNVLIATERLDVGRRVAPPQERCGVSTSGRRYRALSNVRLSWRTSDPFRGGPASWCVRSASNPPVIGGR
jgi:hypothetical protein